MIIDLEIAVDNGVNAGRITIKAIKVQPGLAIHVDPWDKVEGENWTITHIGTGCSVMKGFSRKAAKDIAEKLTKIMDWSEVQDTRTLDTKTKKRIKRFIKLFSP